MAQDPRSEAYLRELRETADLLACILIELAGLTGREPPAPCTWGWDDQPLPWAGITHRLCVIEGRVAHAWRTAATLQRRVTRHEQRLARFQQAFEAPDRLALKPDGVIG